MTLSVVVPTFNESNRAPATVEALLAGLTAQFDGPVEVVLSDDGSDDDTVGAVRARVGHPDGLRVITASANQGKGGALIQAFPEITGDYVLFIDADLPVSIDALPGLVRRAESTGADLVVGSRRIPGAVVVEPQPLARRLGGTGFRAAARLLGYRVTSDPQCGVKLLRSTTMAPVVASCVNRRFAFDIELISRTRAAGLRVVEHPVSWRHVDGSSLRPVRDAAVALRDLARLRAQLARRSSPD